MTESTRRERKKEKTRQALLEVALRLIAERGIYGTRIEDITERTDLGKGAFYNYFDSKDRLIAELVAQGIEVLHRDYLIEDLRAVSQPERIAAVVAAHEAFFRDHPAYVVLLHQARGLVKVGTTSDALEHVFVSYLQRTGEAIVSADERAGLSETDLLELAAMVLGTLAGYRSFRIAARLGVESTIVRDALMAAIPAAIAARLRS